MSVYVQTVGEEKNFPVRPPKPPKHVNLKIGASSQVISWELFTQLLNCTQAFQTNAYPKQVIVGSVSVTIGD